jgi:hypothetical protein
MCTFHQEDNPHLLHAAVAGRSTAGCTATRGGGEGLSEGVLKVAAMVLLEGLLSPQGRSSDHMGTSKPHLGA